MQLVISSIDYAPEDLYEQAPIVAELIRELPGDDRPDYWLAKTQRPIKWIKDSVERHITHLVLAASWNGTKIQSGVEHLPVGIAYVTNRSLLDDIHLDFAKCAYVAVGVASDTTGGKATRPITSVLAGKFTQIFGVRKASDS